MKRNKEKDTSIRATILLAVSKLKPSNDSPTKEVQIEKGMNHIY